MPRKDKKDTKDSIDSKLMDIKTEIAIARYDSAPPFAPKKDRKLKIKA